MTTWFETLTEYAEQRLTPRVEQELYSRGVTDDQARSFRIGYIDRIPDLGGNDDFLQWAKGKSLQDMMVFPLTTTLGEIRGFQFRSVDRGRKIYLDYMPYKEEAVSFGLAQAMQQVWTGGDVWLVEGVFDLLPLQRQVPNIVATLTARVPELMLRVLRRLVDTIWLGYDADLAGQTAITQFMKNHGKEFRVLPVYYPKVKVVGSDRYIKDPGELWEVWGDDQLRDFVQTLLKSHNPPEFFNA